MSDDLEPGWAPLDPSRDPERWESMVRAILERAAPILAGYAARGPADWLASWSRPALAAAAVVSALALGALVAGDREPDIGAAPATASAKRATAHATTSKYAHRIGPSVRNPG